MSTPEMGEIVLNPAPVVPHLRPRTTDAGCGSASRAVVDPAHFDGHRLGNVHAFKVQAAGGVEAVAPVRFDDDPGGQAAFDVVKE